MCDMIALKMIGNVAVSCYNGIRIVDQRVSSRIFMFERTILLTPILRVVDRRTTSSATTPRLKREEIRCIEYDSSFSQWKILIGASDWKYHSAGKEGAERYTTQNLPTYTSPGVYELGIAVATAAVIPVYLGQADNVRGRVQSYGRHGAHLQNPPLLLFSDIFSRGFPIVYRWAPTESKEEAERREEEALAKYDYGWNKRNNGGRRAQEICTKLGFCCDGYRTRCIYK